MNKPKKPSTITLLVEVPRGQCTNTVAAVRSILRGSGDFYDMPVKVSTLHGKVIAPREPTPAMLDGMARATWARDGSDLEMHRRWNGALEALDKETP